MATSAFGRDLPEDQRLAYEEGHDADLIPASGHDTRQRDHKDDPEKHGLSHTSSESLSYRGQDPDVEKAAPDVPVTEKSATETVATERDPNIVDWEGDDDPDCPLNWTPARKWGNIAVLSGITLLTPLASSMFAPGVPRVMEEFKTDNQALATFVVSVYILGYAIGPLVLAPMSELYGRLIVYHVCNWAYVAFTVACALATSMNMLIGFRFMAGVFGVAPLTIGGGTIADLMRPAERGGAMAIWAIGPLLGPVIGPIAGGFLSEAEGWRWIFWVLAIAIGVMALIGLFTMQETYGPTLLARKTKKLQKETGNTALRSKLDLGLTPRAVFWRSIVRPLKLMFLSPICALMSLYMAVVYGILYLLFTTFTFVFEENYGFSESTVGLVYIGMGIGMLGGLALLGATSDPLMKRLAAKHSNGVLKPEYRLPPLMFGAPFIPAGLFIYGWTAQYNVQWAVPIFGTLLVGVGLIAAFMAVNTYLVDAFTLYAASAMAAATVLRSVFGACFPLFGLQMYGAMGLGWGNSLLGFLSIALIPIPFAFYYYGERMRNSKRFKVEF